MYTNTKRALVAMLFVAPLTVGWATPANQMTVESASRLWIEGTSTVRSFECAASSFDLRVATKGPDAARAVLGGEKAVSSVAVTVPSAKLDCDNETMNEHMLKALKANEHGQIVFKVDSYELTGSGADAKVKMSGTLTLGGVQKPISIDADAKAAAPGVIRVVGSHEVRMSEFGLKRPSLMLGTLKVGDAVNVKFDLHLKG